MHDPNPNHRELGISILKSHEIAVKNRGSKQKRNKAIEDYQAKKKLKLGPAKAIHTSAKTVSKTVSKTASTVTKNPVSPWVLLCLVSV